MPASSSHVGSINHIILQDSNFIFSTTTTSGSDCCFRSETLLMRKRQVVVRRSDHESSTTSSFTLRTVRYLECQKNHAAGVGGYAVDGCREFMASGEEGTSDALTCAACGCHRNFHRREVEAEVVCESSNGN